MGYYTSLSIKFEVENPSLMECVIPNENASFNQDTLRYHTGFCSRETPFFCTGTSPSSRHTGLTGCPTLPTRPSSCMSEFNPPRSKLTTWRRRMMSLEVRMMSLKELHCFIATRCSLWRQYVQMMHTTPYQQSEHSEMTTFYH